MVLDYLPRRVTAQEIADDLFISVNTVKTHLGSIYRKLAADDATKWSARPTTSGCSEPTGGPSRGPDSSVHGDRNHLSCLRGPATTLPCEADTLAVGFTGARIYLAAAVAAVVAAVATVVAAIFSSITSAVHPVRHHDGATHRGHGPPPAPGCHRHVSLLPLLRLRRRPRPPRSPPGSECARWPPAGRQHGELPNRTARPTGSPTRAPRPRCRARSFRPGR
jgi:hypothetical protein